MAYSKGDIARNTYDKDVSTHKIVNDTVPNTLFGMGVSLSDDGIKLVASGETFIGVGINDTQRNCGNYVTSTNAWTLDVINDAFVMLDVSGQKNIGALVTVKDGGTFDVTTDATLSIGKITSVGTDLCEVELTGNMITVAGILPETVQGAKKSTNNHARGEVTNREAN